MPTGSERLTVVAHEGAVVQHDRLITGIATALAGCAVLLALLGVIYNPAIIFVALALGAAAYFMWFQASGRLARRVYRSVERQARTDTDGSGSGRRTRQRRSRERGGFGAGPREDWTPPGGRGGRRSRARGDPFGGQGQRQRQRRRAPSTTDGPSEAEAYAVLDVDPGADDDAVKQAYRQKVKEVHPDTDGGDEDEFKRVNRAYERLS